MRTGVQGRCARLTLSRLMIVIVRVIVMVRQSQTKMFHKIINLLWREIARIKIAQEEIELRRLLQFFCRIDGSFEIVARHDGPVIGEQYR